MEGGLLGLFMISAGTFGVLVFHPDSPLAGRLPDGLARRAFMGLAMGSTALGLIHSSWGRRSGAHFNPAVTLAFLRLGKIDGADAILYIAAQFAGSVAGLALLGQALGPWLGHPAVGWAVTVPGPGGAGPAFAAEAAISFVLMLTVLAVSNTRQLAPYTGLAAASLVALYIAFESPVSGMSMNPARSFGSAAVSGVWTGLWIYLAAPPLAMLAAAEVYRAGRGVAAVHCAKLQHDSIHRCIFRCGVPVMAAAASGRGA
jgi:aquaporin Z